MHDRIYDMLMKEDEITWQDIIYELIKKNEMDPWDVDISLLAQKYIETVKKLKEANFFVSGKILLASAILLRIKSDKLVNENIAAFDSLLYPQENIDTFEEPQQQIQEEQPLLLLKTPQTRKRNVSLQDLMNALQKTIDFNQRKFLKRLREESLMYNVKIPEKKIDISKLIKDLYGKIKSFFIKQEKLTFNELVGSNRKEDKIMTFIPLLYLANQNKVDLDQEQPFGEIDIKLIRRRYY